MLENESTVNAEQEEVVTPQPEGEEVESEEVEVAPTATEQSPEENAKFADVRRKAEQAAIDKFVSEQYGASHGIHTKAEFDKAMAQQREAELLERLKSDEVDPKEVYSNLKKNDPDYQELQRIREESYAKSQIEQLNTELKELDLDITIKSLDDITALKNADQVVEHIKAGKTLSEAYFLANKSEIIRKQAEKVQTETLKKTAALDSASPGSLNSNGNEQHQSIYSLSDADFKKMQEDVLMKRRN